MNTNELDTGSGQYVNLRWKHSCTLPKINDALAVETVWKCNCGKYYRLREDQRDGWFWQWYDPQAELTEMYYEK